MIIKIKSNPDEEFLSGDKMVTTSPFTHFWKGLTSPCVPQTLVECLLSLGLSLGLSLSLALQVQRLKVVSPTFSAGRMKRERENEDNEEKHSKL